MAKNKEEMSNFIAIKNSVPLEKKLLLSFNEACAYSGIAASHMSEIIRRSDCDFAIRRKRKFYINRVKLESYIMNLKEI